MRLITFSCMDESPRETNSNYSVEGSLRKTA